MASWTDVTRTSGGAYSTAADERWRFAQFGDYVLATNFTDNVQAWDLTSSTKFADLAGSPPKAKFIAVVRNFVVLGNLSTDARGLHWSDDNNAEFWTAGSNKSDVDSRPDGGPITGLVGGEVGYIFQREAVTRMTFLPGSSLIFEFDKLESGRGCYAPDSLVHNGSMAYYYGYDGFYSMNLVTGVSQPLGVGKWRDYVNADVVSGTQNYMFAALAPNLPLYMCAYVSQSAVDQTVPDRVLVYDWSIDEASLIDMKVCALARWLTSGIDLDSLDSEGTLETLPHSLDSDVWKGGAPLMGIFSSDNKLSYMTGSAMAAEFVTADGKVDGRRQLIRFTRPDIDATDLTVEIASRERDGDTVSYDAAESLGETGLVPALSSGNYFRARIRVPAGESWTFAKGLETDNVDAGII